MTETRQGKIREDKQQVSFVAYKTDIEVLKKIARQKGISSSALLNMLLREFIDNQNEK